MLALGCLGYYGASILDFWGLAYISAGLERLILFTYPTLTILIGVLFQGKAFTRREVIAIALCYTGIGFAFIHDLGLGDTRSVLIGRGAGLRLQRVVRLLPVGQRADDRPPGRHAFLALAMLFSSAVTLIHFLASSRSPPLSSRCRCMVGRWPWRAVRPVIPVFALSAAIRRIGAGPASLFGMVGPILTIGFGWWLLDEPISIEQTIGAIFCCSWDIPHRQPPLVASVRIRA